MIVSLEARLRRAGALRQAGRAAEAAAAYEAILAEYPDLPDSWYNLALMLRRCGRPQEALDAYAEAIKRGARGAEEIHLNRAVILADDLRRPEEAEGELTRALILDPDYAPALLNLGNLHEDRGARDAALGCYRRILARHPNDAEALSRFAGLHAPVSPDDPVIARVRQTLALARDRSAKAALGFALGRLYDACGAYDQAFAAYLDANRQAGAGVRYDRKAQEQLIDAIIAAFPDGRAQKGNGPVFICGMFRSGSTLAEQVIARHPEAEAGGELDFIPALARRELAPFPEAMATAGARLGEWAASYRAHLAALHPAAKLVTDKRPDNFLYIGLIKRLFADARIVHTRRDVLDNCLSIFFLHLDPSMSYAFDLADIAHYFRQYRRLMAHWRALFGDDILDFDYDDFVREPEAEARRLLDFCGLDWHADCLSFHLARNPVKTASVWQVRQPLYRKSSGRWRHYEKHLSGLRKEWGV